MPLVMMGEMPSSMSVPRDEARICGREGAEAA
jgi:hypothetical protein